MNMHVPQSIAAETELAQLASVLRMIIAPRSHAPIIQLVQDTLTGAFRMSFPEVRIPEHVVMNMLARLKLPLSSFKFRGEDYTGAEAISFGFPAINLNGSVTLKEGKLTKGLLDKNAFASASKGILHVTYNDMGPDRCGQVINDMQTIITKFNLYTGFSVGTSDLIVDDQTNEFVLEVIRKNRDKVKDILRMMHEGTFQNTSGRSDGDELENQILQTLNDISKEISTKVVESLPKSNRMLQMVNAGTKGSGLNITQMMALLGQQNVESKRIQYTLQDRTLPYFPKYDDGIESRGFVESSYVSGLKPAEFFFHAMGGREGLIDTAVKTSDTGYIQRKLVKTLEDLRSEHDGTVRGAGGVLVQYKYGEDGVDTIALEKQECRIALMTMEDIYREYGLSVDDVNQVSSAEVSEAPDMVEDILRDREMMVKDVFNYTFKDSVLAPVHMKRLLAGYNNPYSTKTDLTPRHVVDELNKLMAQPWFASNRVFHVLLRYSLAPKKAIVVHRMTEAMFDDCLREIQFRYVKSLVHPGEMVGALAAQSIGEPTTQLTLNTFHSAGTIKAAGTSGVPRIQELLSLSRNIKKPLNAVYLHPSVGESYENTIRFMHNIQKTTLRDITKSVRIYYDPEESAVEEDAELLKTYKLFSLEQREACRSPWIMRLEFDEVKLAAHQLTDMVTIQNALLANESLGILSCVHSDANAQKLVMRLVFAEETRFDALGLRFVEEKVLDTILAGIKGVGRVYIRVLDKMAIQELSWHDEIGGYKGRQEWLLDVEGNNLMELLAHDKVDTTRTFSNDIHEIMEVFGIEAARTALKDEFTTVFEEAYVNYHHLSVLLDAMTYQGRLVSVDRFGMQKHSSGVLAKSSFEMTAQVLFDAAVTAEKDEMRGVSANIMFGQRPPCGTGFVDILLDEMRMPEGAEVEEGAEELTDLEKRLETLRMKEEGECRMEDILMDW
jgi:DNA-directed RNA polymerase II subunit RPB1